MEYRAVFKWLTITLIVLTGFLTILLFLGYLLKENADLTTKMKAQLEQKAQQSNERNKLKHVFEQTKILTSSESSQLKIIKENQYCESVQQCFLLQTGNKRLGCLVSVNSKGAAILLKIAAHKAVTQVSKQQCHYGDTQAKNTSVQCVNNQCIYPFDNL